MRRGARHHYALYDYPYEIEGMMKQPPTPLTTTQARTQLPALVRKIARSKPTAALTQTAVVIHARGEQTPVMLLSGASVAAAEQRIAELEEELEDIALMRLIEQREINDSGRRVTVDDLALELGIPLG